MAKSKHEMRQEAIKRLNEMYEAGPYTTQDIVVALAGSSGWVGRIIDLLTDNERLTEDDYLALLRDAARDYVRTQTYYKRLLRECNRFCEDNYMQLPRDVNGEVIELWDKITYHGPYSRCRDRVFEVRGYCASGRTIGAVFVNCDGDYVDLAAKECCHYYKPTVEDVLREFADEVQRCCDTEDTIAEYAKRMRLKEDE